MNTKTIPLLIFSCITGIVILIIEVTGSRLIAPYLGTSIYVWTSIIGTILFSLAIGYHFGGKMADNGADKKTLGFLYGLGSVFLCLTLFETLFLPLFLEIESIRLGSILASLLLFSPVMIILGMVSPILSRLSINSVEHSGKIMGTFSAISTLGGILGTFIGGFYLFAILGSQEIVLLMACILSLLSVLLYTFHHRFKKMYFREVFFIFFQIVIILCAFILISQKNEGVLEDTDTLYSRILIYEYPEAGTGRTIRAYTNSARGQQSAIFPDSPHELVFSYARLFNIYKAFVDRPKSALMIGAGGFTYPRYFLLKEPTAEVTIVEIDTALEALAKKYFFLKDDSRMNIIYEDGRRFLAKNTNTYDTIFLDAFKSDINIPFEIITREALLQVKRALTPHGVFIINSIGAFEAPENKLVGSVIKTLQEHFSYVHAFQADTKESSTSIQNIIIVASMSNPLPHSSAEITKLLTQEKHIDANGTYVLRDNFAPVEILSGL